MLPTRLDAGDFALEIGVDAIATLMRESLATHVVSQRVFARAAWRYGAGGGRIMARSIPGQRTRRPGRLGKQPKGRAQQSGRKRGAKRPTKERPLKENMPPSAPRTKGQLEQGPGSKGHARIGRRGKERPHPRERAESGFSVRIEGMRPRTR